MYMCVFVCVCVCVSIFSIIIILAMPRCMAYLGLDWWAMLQCPRLVAVAW